MSATRGSFAVAGLVLIPAGIVLAAGDATVAGTVLLTVGWVLVVAVWCSRSEQHIRGRLRFALSP